MKLNLDITHVILIVVGALFFWMYLSKTPEVIQDATNETKLLKTIEMQDSLLFVSNFKIDSIGEKLSVALREKEIAEKKLEILNNEHNEEIDDIDNQFITADINLFRTNFLSSSSSK
jgi:hypothetical protein